MAFTTVLILPTGRTADQTTPPLFAGTTGRRTWAGGLSVKSEYAFLPWFVRLDAGATGFAPSTQGGHRRQHGLLMAVALSAGRELGSGKVVVALAFSQEWQRPLHQDGRSVADSEAHLSVLALSISLRVAPHWTVVSGVSSSYWPDGMGRNRDARVGLNSGVRYGHF